MGNLSIPLSVQKLQTALQAKAKENPGFRFYALYDKVHRDDILEFAYLRRKSNGGAAGVDEQDFEDIEAYGRERWLGELAQELRQKKYQPQAVRRVFIPKRGGTGLRPLGIPSIRVRRQIESIREKTAKRRALLPAEQIVTELNDGLRGWANYFALGPVEDAYRAIESYVTRRLRRWLCIKHEVRGSGSYRFTDQYLHDQLGLVRIRDLLHNFPWATA